MHSSLLPLLSHSSSSLLALSLPLPSPPSCSPQLMANLEHSAVARAAIALASRDAKVVPTTVEALTVDSLVLPKQHVAVLKVPRATITEWNCQKVQLVRSAT